VLSTIVGALGSVFLKLGSKNLKLSELISNKMLFIGFFLFVVATILMIVALKFGELSKIFPITSLTYVWVAILSSRFLKEKMTREKLAAFALIIIGILFVAS
jgi:uncharacterized membrane protein